MPKPWAIRWISAGASLHLVLAWPMPMMLLGNPRTNTRTRTYNLHCISHWHEFWRAHWRSDKNTTNTTVGGRGMWWRRHMARTNHTLYTQICGSIPTWFQELDTRQMLRCVSFIMIRCYSFAVVTLMQRWGGRGGRRAGGVASSHCRGSRNSTLSPYPCIVDVWSWDWEMSGLAAGKKMMCFFLENGLLDHDHFIWNTCRHDIHS